MILVIFRKQRTESSIPEEEQITPALLTPSAQFFRLGLGLCGAVPAPGIPEELQPFQRQQLPLSAVPEDCGRLQTLSAQSYQPN